MVPKRCIGVLLAFCAGLADAALEPSVSLVDRPLADVLADYEAAGYTFIYSTELVRRHTRITVEPSPGDAVARLREGLAAIGLVLRDGLADNAYLIVAAPMTVVVEDSAQAPVNEPAESPPALDPRIEEVVVAASRYRIGKHGALSRHVLDDALDVHLPATGDALRVVNKLPGARTIGLSAIPRLRGGLRDETLVLFNNVELLEPVHLKDFHGLFAGLDPRVMESIDVYTGGFPARYGNRMSGVLDIEPAEPPPRPAGALTASVFNVGAMAHGRTADRRGDWALSTRRGNLDVIARRLERNVGTPSFHDAYGRLGWAIGSGTHLEAGLILYNDDVEAIDDGPHDEHAFSSYRNTYGWTQLRRESPNGLHARTLLSYASIRHGRSGTRRGSGADRSFGTVDDLRRFRILDIAQEATFDRDGWSAELGGGVRLASGRYDYLASGHRGTFGVLLGQPRDVGHRVRARPDRRAGHLYGSVSLAPLQSVTMEAGLRWDRQRYDDAGENQISPRLTLRYDVDPTTSITVAAGSFSQPHGIHELQVEDGQSRYQRSQNANHFIAGVDRRFPNIGLQIHAEVYVKRFTRPKRRFENLLYPFVLLPELAPDRLASHPSAARARGAEITLRYRPSNALNGWFSYSRGEVEDRIDGQWRPRRWDQTNSVSAGLAWTTDRWTAAATYLWHDGWRATRLPTFVPEGHGLAPEWNAEQLPAFASLDVRVSRKWQWSVHALTLFVECANILDRINAGGIEYDLRRDTVQGGFAVTGEHRKLFPIVPSVGAVWEFR